MLSITDLTTGYGKGAIFSFKDIALDPGQTGLIKGPSGSGKTTLLHTIAGFLAPLSGSVTLDDVNIHTLDEGSRDLLRGRKIGIVFQTLHLVNSLSVRRNLELSAYASGQSYNSPHAEKLLDQLGISSLYDKSPAEISQGQAQRVAIARALLNRPSLVLADEPTSSLDEKSCKETLALLRTLCSENNSILLISSHDARLGDDFDHIINLGETT